MRKCLQRRILPSWSFLIAMHPFIQKQMSPTELPRKAWMTLSMICTYVSNTQNSWYPSWSSGTRSGRCKDQQFQDTEQWVCLILQHGKQVVLLQRCLVYSPILLPSQLHRLAVFHTLPIEVWRLCSCTMGINTTAFPLPTQFIWSPMTI